ncbi:dynein axonemal heavy chain 10-like isoform X1 [Ruditapes philippinarum]|uniref:dynein axonemal heavy chain 10-like isoform X1 n=1 Tax=Ruditapes philippinarum TaxID=129788 RepID=UPI00295B5ADA|nr:dynein axonemal heavy chain 10-like isoform X1 [Ruditapes philippinarum]
MTSSGQVIDDDRISRISVASNAVAAIPKSDLTETKSYAAPPQAVKDVLEAVMILVGYKGADLDWKNIKKVIGGTQFLKTIGDIDYEKISQETRAKAMNKVSEYSHESIKAISSATTIFYDWVIAVAKE